MFKPLSIIGLVSILIIFGCGNDNSLKEKELELRERELELREKEMDERQSDTHSGNYQGENDYQTEDIAEENNPELAEGDGALGKIYDKEIKTPAKYLSAEYTYRVTMIGNTIINGTISNSATVAGFKNVEITVYFFSKTDHLLGKETFTVMEFVSPNSSISFNYKMNRWYDNISYSKGRIVSAEPY